MTLVHRVLFPSPISSLDEYFERNGGGGLVAARKLDPAAIIAEVTASGLRGRGGAGFPTGVKWGTIAANRSASEPATVVVNGAEGEPGTFKDRTIVRNDPYQVVEGALIAALAVGADRVVFGLKRSFGPEVERLRSAIAEFEKADITGSVALSVFEGPDEYLYGEETALLESINGRYPFPHIAPPFRRGVDELLGDGDDPAGSRQAAHVAMAAPGMLSAAAPTLVDNIETIANIARIISRGARWFRTEGTEQSPGTIVVTVTGSTVRHGVGEVMMGTTLRDAIELIGGGPRPGHEIKAVLSGVSNALLPAALLDTPLTYEDMAAAGSGLGSAGFMVLDDHDDLVSIIAGVSRFLAVESCGQCTPCKQDGLTIAKGLHDLARNASPEADRVKWQRRITTVADGARCYLATQQQVVVASLFEKFPDEVEAHIRGTATPIEPALIAELVDIDGGIATFDERHLDKQPDWTYGDDWSGQAPADRYR